VRLRTTRTTTYARDALGRVTAVNRPEGDIGMGWDNASNLTLYTDNGGSIAYGYNDADQLTTLAMPGGNCTGVSYASPGSAASKCVTFRNDDDGRRTGVKYPGGTTWQEMTRDKSGRITGILAKTGSTPTTQLDLTYSYATGGTDTKVVTKAIDNKTGLSASYGFDQDHRLLNANTTVTSGGAQSAYERFCYDKAGNRTKYYRGTPVSDCTGTAQATATYNGANEMTAATGVTPTGAPLAGTTLSYDANGNETAAKSAIGRTTTYGDRGQATSFTPAGGSALNQDYIGGGNLERIASGSTTFLPTSLSPAPAWSAASGTSTWAVRDPDGQLIAVRIGSTSSPTSATEYYPFSDNLANVRAMTTATGASPSVTYSYSAFGTITATTGSLVQPYRYGQGYTDSSTGLIKLGIRYYDPTHGRFTQQDPTGQRKIPTPTAQLVPSPCQTRTVRARPDTRGFAPSAPTRPR
jgi:RHS repeat-associated protein